MSNLEVLFKKQLDLHRKEQGTVPLISSKNINTIKNG